MQTIQFIQDNWGKLSAVSLGAFHAVMLHKDQIAAGYQWAKDEGGIIRVIANVLWVPKPKPISTDTKPASTDAPPKANP